VRAVAVATLFGIAGPVAAAPTGLAGPPTVSIERALPGFARALVPKVKPLTAPAPGFDGACVRYCRQRIDDGLARCMVESDAPDDCTEARDARFDGCVKVQCTLDLAPPDAGELDAMAARLIPELLGTYDIVERHRHVWATPDQVSVVYVLRGEDGGSAFLELGATLSLPPVVSFSEGLPIGERHLKRARTRLASAFGPGPYTLAARRFSALLPIFEFSAHGRRFAYDPTRDTVTDAFHVTAAPSDDFEVRKQAFARQWADARR